MMKESCDGKQIDDVVAGCYFALSLWFRQSERLVGRVEQLKFLVESQSDGQHADELPRIAGGRQTM